MSHPGSSILIANDERRIRTFWPGAHRSKPHSAREPIPHEQRDSDPERRKSFPVKTARNRAEAGFVALENINLEIKAGEFFVIVGPSGCGKSTLLDLLGGLTRPTSGRILIGGSPVTGPALDRGLVFQQYALFPWRTAQKNVEFGLEAKGVPSRERADRAKRFLAYGRACGIPRPLSS